MRVALACSVVAMAVVVVSGMCSRLDAQLTEICAVTVGDHTNDEHGAGRANLPQQKTGSQSLHGDHCPIESLGHAPPSNGGPGARLPHPPLA